VGFNLKLRVPIHRAEFAVDWDSLGQGS
jgi:hypothetical protein